jgi:cytochrome oxidase assembly protein ShyY1
MNLKDKRSRPYDINSGETVVKGLLKISEEPHRFSVPNNISKGVWRNVNISEMIQSLELTGSLHEFVYLEETKADSSQHQDTYPLSTIYEDLKPKLIYKCLMFPSAISSVIFFFFVGI